MVLARDGRQAVEGAGVVLEAEREVASGGARDLDAEVEVRCRANAPSERLVEHRVDADRPRAGPSPGDQAQLGAGEVGMVRCIDDRGQVEARLEAAAEPEAELRRQARAPAETTSPG